MREKRSRRASRFERIIHSSSLLLIPYTLSFFFCSFYILRDGCSSSFGGIIQSAYQKKHTVKLTLNCRRRSPWCVIIEEKRSKLLPRASHTIHLLIRAGRQLTLTGSVFRIKFPFWMIFAVHYFYRAQRCE